MTATATGLSGRLQEAASHTLVYGLGSVAQLLIGIVLLPLYAHYYSAAEFGVLSLVTLVATLAGSVFYLGSSSALARSYYDYDDEAERRRTVTTALVITLCGAALQLAVGVPLAARVSGQLFGTRAYAPHIVVALASSAVTFINSLFLVILRFERRSLAVVVVNIVALFVTTALIVWLLFVRQQGLMAALAGPLVAQLLLCVPLLWMVRGHFARGISRREVRVQLRFGLGAVGVGVAYYVLDGADRFLVNRFSSLTEVGVYSLGYRIGMLIHVLFILPFAQIWTPMRMQYRNDADAGEFFKLVLTYYWMIGLLATVAVATFAREIIMVAGSAEYLPAYRVVPIVMLSHLIYGVIGVVDTGIIFSRKVAYHVALFTGGIVLNVGLNLLFIPRWGYMAAAYVTLISYSAVAWGAFVVANRLYPLQVERRRIRAVIASAVAVLTAGTLLAGAPVLPAVTGRLLLLAALIISWYLWVLSDRERAGLERVRAKFV
jgi:O-antigen/teichoic acid export membrane protein